MEDLANAFSVLELDAEDDDQAREASSVSKNKDDTTKSSGLNVEVDRILEIACIITDGKLTKSVEGPDLVIHQTKECLDRMGEWCRSHHKASGLTKKMLESTISEREAEKQVIEFVTRIVGTYTPQLAGNSVYVDFAFLKIIRMPLLKKIITEPWMILEKVSGNLNTTRRIYSKHLKNDTRRLQSSESMDCFIEV
ncbi:hypothetical protein PRUPE_2G051000 [Prunus persica]|uniref:Exonuclease domain-containing protein n=1 Tax=Prunus persica TaxID=3760 RepID=A0A251QBL5_PRUPE|nr:hypothetical protein PRUPE_2G051000 [Prunus persica]